jgi:hypothetical protein
VDSSGPQHRSHTVNGMGQIFYGAGETAVEIDDRALAHLKVVIATKLRRGESFTVSLTHPDSEEGGRSTLWFAPSIPLRFVFDDPEPAEISREWIEELARSAHSSGGIALPPERARPGDDAG